MGLGENGRTGRQEFRPTRFIADCPEIYCLVNENCIGRGITGKEGYDTGRDRVKQQ